MGRTRFAVLLALLVSVSGVAAALQFSGSGGTFSTSQEAIDLSYVDSDLGGNLTVSYFENGSLINSSSDASQDYQVSFDTIPTDSFEVFNLSAEASNSSSYGNETRYIILEVDRDPPKIDEDSFSNNRYDDGDIELSFTVYENGTGLDEVKVVRRFNGTNKTLETVEPDQDSEDFTFDDPNERNIYGMAFNYTVNVEDVIDNSDTYDYDASIYPEDGEPPELVDVSPRDGAVINNVQTDNFTVEFRDTLSGLEGINITLGPKSRKLTNISSETRSVTFDISNFDDTETFTADMRVTDKAGNNESYSSQFTTDRTAPDVEGDRYPDQRFIQEPTELGIDVDGEDVSNVANVTCYLEGNSLETDTSPNDDQIYSCGNVDPSNYEDGEKDLYAVYSDELGNTQRVQIGSWIFDTRRPEIESIDLIPVYGWESPEVRLFVTDEVAQIDELQYWFDVYSERETLDEVPSLRAADISFRPDIAGFNDGEYSLHVRVSDVTGKWSDVHETKFYLRTDERPEPVLEYDSLSLPSDGSTEFEVEIRNRGQVGMLDGRINVTGAVRGSKNLGYMQKGESRDLEIEVEAQNASGVYNSTIIVDSRTVNREFSVETILKATEEERENLDSRIRGFDSRLTKINQNYTDIDKARIGDYRLQQVESDIETLRESVQQAENFSDRGEYYRVARMIPKLEKQSSAATKSVKDLKQYREQLNLAIKVLAFLLPVSAILGVYISKRENFEVKKKARKMVLNPIWSRIRGAINFLTPVRTYRYVRDSIKYSDTGMAITMKSYKIKRKIKKFLKGEGVDWKGYH